MKFDTIIDTTPKQASFEVHRSKTGNPCILGNTGTGGSFSLKVIRVSGGRETIYPLPVRDLCLYEVAVGDTIVITEDKDGTFVMRPFCVQKITDEHVVAVWPAQ